MSDSKLINELTEIKQEYDQDIEFDEFKIREIQLKIPALKAKWAAKLSVTEATYYEWKEKRNLLFDALLHEIDTTTDKPLTNNTKELMVKRDSRYKKVSEKIKSMEIIIKFLERIDRNVQGMTWDLKNILEELKLENM